MPEPADLSGNDECQVERVSEVVHEFFKQGLTPADRGADLQWRTHLPLHSVAPIASAGEYLCLLR